MKSDGLPRPKSISDFEAALSRAESGGGDVVQAGPGAGGENRGLAWVRTSRALGPHKEDGSYTLEDLWIHRVFP